MRRIRRARGQVVVETAIVMPVFVFLILGLLQMGLLHHARIMTKYASYKAVRAGALRRGDPTAMKNAAMAVMLPVIGRDSTVGAPYRTDDIARYGIAWSSMKNATQDGHPFVEVKVCNPTRGQVTANDDFDDPRKAMRVSKAQAPDPPDPDDPPNPNPPPAPPAGVSSAANFGWKGFNNTKLQVQVTTYYRMYIPFANFMVWRIASGKPMNNPPKQRWLGWRDNGLDTKLGVNTQTRTIDTLSNSADNRKYIMPIRNSYSMRMQSNFSAAGVNGLSGANGSYTARDCKVGFVP